jgi:hypothetical protein
VIVDGDRKNALGLVLVDHVLVEDLADINRTRHRGNGTDGLFLVTLLGDNVVAEVDALIADVNGRTRYKFAYLFLSLSAERTYEVASAVFSVFRH